MTSSRPRASDLALDGDILTKREHLVRYLGQPSPEVALGGRTAKGQNKLHLHWRPDEAAPWEDLRLACARGEATELKVGGDTSFGSLHQPSRVAGTTHGKSNRRSRVRLIAHTFGENEFAELAEAARAMRVARFETAHRCTENWS